MSLVDASATKSLCRIRGFVIKNKCLFDAGRAHKSGTGSESSRCLSPICATR